MLGSNTSNDGGTFSNHQAPSGVNIAFDGSGNVTLPSLNSTQDDALDGDDYSLLNKHRPVYSTADSNISINVNISFDPYTASNNTNFTGRF